ncbi:MAG: hypothetical protein M1828_005273 [Chrysothrix sp. TS-e1954]|nr:MAG: hypothetical protein M1828_005273 [Chrysothrix sp. TS-e1954]
MEKQSSDGSGPRHESPSSKPQTYVQSREEQQTSSPAPKKPSIPKRLWKKSGLDIPSVIILLKAGVPIAIALAIYQIDAVANHFTTIGYLIAVMGILGAPVLPRAKFIQGMILNIAALCIGCSVALLAIWCANQARLHTTPAGQPPGGYNSSASAVAAIWLFFLTYLGNAVRSARPQLQIPMIVFSIFINISSVYSPNFATIQVGKAFATKLLEVFLSGFAIAVGVHFLVFPITMRKPVFGMMTGYLQTVRGVLRAQVGYVRGLETENYFARAEASGAESSSDDDQKHNRASQKPGHSALPPQVMAVKAATGAMIALNAKLKTEIPFAKREVALGKLDAEDLKNLFKKTRNVTLPLIGLSSIIDILERISKAEGWNTLTKSSVANLDNEKVTKSFASFQATMRSLHEPFAQISTAMDEAVEHIMYQLEFTKRPKKTKTGDEESRSDHPQPGDKDFAHHLAERARAFFDDRVVTLRQFCERRGIDLPAGAFDASAPFPGQFKTMDESALNSDRRQVFIVLYMEYLLGRASRSLLELVRFADSKVEDGTMKKTRLIVPTFKRLKKWINSAVAQGDIGSEDQGVIDPPNSYELAFGDAFLSKRDAEHLPPQNLVERIGDHIRVIPHILRSRHSVFGFRAACATLSIAIVAYLKDSYMFFTKQRVVWALIMVAFSMRRTAGSSVFQFVLRLSSAVIAMVASYIIWYIVDGHAAGVIVFTYLLIGPCFLLVVKKPQYAIMGILSAVNTLLIIGYELQVQKLPTKVSLSNGQPIYPTYELAPYRLAAVATGLAIAYFWTIFPYPVTEHGELRRTLGGTLYILANYYAVVHESIGARVRGDEGDEHDKNSPGRRLAKARLDAFTKVQVLLAELKEGSSFTKFQINVGGRFPKEIYDRIILCCEKIVAHAALIGYASTSFAQHPVAVADTTAPPDANTNADLTTPPTSSAWLTDFRTLLRNTQTTSHEITSILSLLSSSISNNQPLPPYLKAPEPFGLLVKLQALDADILSVRHMAEPGYAAFAVMQIASRGLLGDVEECVGFVRELVGELDFSFHSVVSEDVAGLGRRVTRVGNGGAGGGGGGAGGRGGYGGQVGGKGKSD